MRSQEDWDALQALFENALRQPPAERAVFLRNHTDNEAIRAEVESLLAAHERAGEFMEQPAPGAVIGNESRAAASPLTAGTRLGAFEILEQLGAGGMGEVYRARDTRLDRFVAVKVLSPELDLAVQGRQRFEREARAISKLSHPHICTVHDVGEAHVQGRDIPFLVLELLDGETLAARLRRGRVPIEQALAFAIDMADALAVAHGQGVVHRDVKPSNVMVTRSGLKLLDFGLAQLRAPAGAADASAMTRDSSLTNVGMVVGTLPYLAPEQLDGRKADARSDIFSFGAVLYEMLTGHRAFPGDSGRSAAAQILSDDPRPVHELEPSVSVELAKIVSHCLRKDPERRYHDIADVKVALEDVRDELRVPVRAHAGPRWRWAWMLVLPLVALGAAYLAWSPRAAPETSPAPHVVPLTTLPGAEFSPTLSPDGQSVAFVWSGVNRDNDDIYVQRIGSGSEVRRTTHPAHDFSPSWSPDGQWIAFLRGEVPGRSELMLVSPLGGPEQPLGEIDIRDPYAYPPHLAWLPDSQALIVVHSPDKSTGLSVFSIHTHERQALTSPPVSPGFDRAPAVSPDGRMVAFIRGPDIFVAGIAADRRAVLSPRPLVHWPFATAMTWTSDGNEIVFASGGSLWRVDASGARPPAIVPFVGRDAYMPVLSRPGGGSSIRLVYVQLTSDANIWRLDLPAAGAAPSASPAVFSRSTKLDANAQFSPDGKRVAFQSSRSGIREIWIADSDGGNPVPLASTGKGAQGSPRWSPDGKSIAFDANVDGQWDIYMIAAGGGTPQRMTFEPVEDSIPSFSRDGKFLYFTSTRSGTSDIWKTPVSGGAAVRVTYNGGVVAFESADGRYVYYTQSHNGPSSLWRVSVAGGGVPERVLDGVTARAFQVIDRGIYYLERDANTVVTLMGPQASVGLESEERATLRFFDFSNARTRTLAHLERPIAIGLAVSRDGRTVLYTQIDDVTGDLMMVENFR